MLLRSLQDPERQAEIEAKRDAGRWRWTCAAMYLWQAPAAPEAAPLHQQDATPFHRRGPGHRTERQLTEAMRCQLVGSSKEP
mmetsp:Transcript_117041/g.331245  ORF Transcript_117041/g.331245 Transcript_117041/m.331245 type:complete len:82 (+) Transcript_117041:1001-1246(+)